jgi:hypothetical protein
MSKETNIKLIEEGIELVTNCNQFKLPVQDGKMRLWKNENQYSGLLRYARNDGKTKILENTHSSHN